MGLSLPTRSLLLRIFFTRKWEARLSYHSYEGPITLGSGPSTSSGSEPIVCVGAIGRLAKRAEEVECVLLYIEQVMCDISLISYDYGRHRDVHLTQL